MHEGFVDLAEYIPGVVIDARYAGSHNLVGEPLDGYRANKAFAVREAADAMKKAYNVFRQMGYGVIIYDAYRPQKAVDHFVRWANAPETMLTKTEFYPDIEKTQLFPLGYIAAKSGHTRGSTIDLTLTKDGVPLDMGTDFDWMMDKSHQCAKGLTQEQMDNRALLRGVMCWAGFRPIESEWWHFNLMEEPYPTTYFDFDIE